jgi:potassium/hydrogen antiporter
VFSIELLILITAILVLLGVASSKLSARAGVPVLVVFLGLGMLAGSEGIGGIDFENYQLAYSIGTLALALILFDGGLRTPKSSIVDSWRPSLSLATIGVMITAVMTGVASSYILGVSWLEGLLIGSIVGSTDAAAVFSILRTGGVKLSKRLTGTLEIESGSNDPMAIFMTIGCIEVLTGEMSFGIELVGLFVRQSAIGILVGIAVGFFAVKAINRIHMDAAGLYPVFATAFGLLAFGLSAWLGGSGFLSVYLAGIILGNSELVFKRGIFLFHDAVAWLSQIVMFVVLGLLSFPSRLFAVSLQGLLIAIVLILIARPIAVLISLLPFHFSRRELTLLSWVGLKGAVPITLATFPLLYGVEGSPLIFDVVFFVVVVSALVQGWTIPLFARKLGLQVPSDITPPITLEISSLRHVNGDIVDYFIDDQCRASGRRVRELALPTGVVIALVVRSERFIPPQGDTKLESGDHVVVVLEPQSRPLVDQVFVRNSDEHTAIPTHLEFPLRASISVGELEEFYGIEMSLPRTLTLGEAIKTKAKSPLSEQTLVSFGAISLRVRQWDASGNITSVGMIVH